MDSKNYLLKKATMEDYDFIYGVKKITLRNHIEKIWGWDEKYQQNDFSKSFLPNRNNIIILNGSNIGVLEINEEDKIIYVVELEILPQFQGKGIGSNILNDIIEDAKKKDKKVQVGCFKVNERAKELYLKLGFKIIDDTRTHFILEK